MKDLRERAQVLNLPLPSCVKLVVNDRVKEFTNKDTIEDTTNNADDTTPT